MPDCLQVSTACLMLSRLSKAVLAVVVNHTPLMALGFHRGPGGGGGGGVVVVLLFPFLLQAERLSKPHTGNIVAHIIKGSRLLFILNYFCYCFALTKASCRSEPLLPDNE